MTASDISIRYAETDEDVILIHRFLCIVAGRTLPGPIDPAKSATEVWRVAHQDVALMAMRGNIMVGTLGLICPDWWWGKSKFLSNRWFFTLPGSRAGKPLLKEAKAIAVASNFELIIISEERGKITILNKSKLRNGDTHVLRQFATDPNPGVDHDARTMANGSRQ